MLKWLPWLYIVFSRPLFSNIFWQIRWVLEKHRPAGYLVHSIRFICSVAYRRWLVEKLVLIGCLWTRLDATEEDGSSPHFKNFSAYYSFTSFGDVPHEAVLTLSMHRSLSKLVMSLIHDVMYDLLADPSRQWKSTFLDPLQYASEAVLFLNLSLIFMQYPRSKRGARSQTRNSHGHILRQTSHHNGRSSKAVVWQTSDLDRNVAIQNSAHLQSWQFVSRCP